MEQIIIYSATISVLLFGLIGIIDGFYYHIWKFKLHKHPETRFEHITHSLRAAIFLALLILLFQYDFGSMPLYVTVGLVALDIIVLLIDLVAEGDSRRNLGGLPHREYIVHVVANTLHYVALALILVAKPIEAWSPESPVELSREFPEITTLVAKNLIPGVALLTLAHILLMNKKFADKFDSLKDSLQRAFHK